MKTISVGVLGLGVLCLITAFVETFAQVYLMHVHPMNLITLATCLFMLAIALMCCHRFYGGSPESK
ncbi:MAG: hypothetical protein JSR48_10095 [Verrucomicrobia bacterium]|nr:hypothetical protein [Verrucomicrobiota bacterium]